MTLRETLNERHHRELTFMKALSLGDDGEVLDRQELTNRLERAMLADDILARTMARLSVDEKAVIKTLLHSDRFAADSSHLRKGESSGQWQAAKTTELLLSLERKGFVCMAKESDWWHKKWYTARIPLELARMLGSLWGIDNRVREQILSLREALASLSSRRLEALALRDGVVSHDREHLLDDLTSALSSAASVEARMASLPDEDLRHAARTVMCTHGGLLLLSRLDRRTRALAEERKHEWRRMLEEAMLGSIGQISLIDAGLAVEGEHFVVYLENVDGYFRTSQIPDHVVAPPRTEAVDFIIDLSSILCFTAQHEAKVTRDGTVYKSTATKLIAQCLMKQHVAIDQRELLDFKIRVCTTLGLLSVDSERHLAVGPNASTWETRGLREKLSLMYRFIVHAETRRRSERWIQAVERGLLALLPNLDHGGWRPRHGLVMRASARYVIDAVKESRDRAHHGSAINHRHYNYRTLDQLRRVLENDLIRPLCVARIIEYGSKAEQPFAMRLSPMGCVLLGLPPREIDGDRQPRIIVTPDFEVLLFPEGDYFSLKQKMAAFCKPIKTEQVFHFKLVRERVAHAVTCGLTSGAILDTLRKHSANPLPQNVVYSIEDWAGRA